MVAPKIELELTKLRGHIKCYLRLRNVTQFRKSITPISGRKGWHNHLWQGTNLLGKMANQPGLLDKLLAIVDEILILNDELIYPDDREPRSDEDRGERPLHFQLLDPISSQ